MDSIQGFLPLLAAFVPTLVGTLIADYWIMGKGRVENFKMREGFCAPVWFLLSRAWSTGSPVCGLYPMRNDSDGTLRADGT
jgi:purine-cytosine permease-like protein